MPFFLLLQNHIFDQKTDQKHLKVVQEMVFEQFKNYHVLRYYIYEFLKKGSDGPRLVITHCGVGGAWGGITVSPFQAMILLDSCLGQNCREASIADTVGSGVKRM